MPVSEFAAHHRAKVQDAFGQMGWYEADPLRGCGRLIVDVICREHGLRPATSAAPIGGAPAPRLQP